MSSSNSDGNSNPEAPPLSFGVKVLRPPTGVQSKKKDEHCFTYCSQTVAGRHNNKSPKCSTVCFRKVFPHEVRKLIAFSNNAAAKSQQDHPEGKIPLPPDGQNIPRWLGGPAVEYENDDDDDVPKKKNPKVKLLRPAHPNSSDLKYWEEGWYLWIGRGSGGSAAEKLQTMMFSPARLERWQAKKALDNKRWETYQTMKRPDIPPQSIELPDGTRIPNQFFGPVIPQHWDVEPGYLIPLPPPVGPIYQQVERLLAPTHKLLGLAHETLQSGDQAKFAGLMWEKAWTKEPFILANNIASRLWEMFWRGPPQ